ncbi:MAG: response regulator [Bacteroidia bacterium]|nr:MAG: response regulator [Bacteroidia bacterium]
MFISGQGKGLFVKRIILLLLLLTALRWQSYMGRLIFFIDDDKVILNLLEYTFQSRHDYDVVCYKTGEECLENLQRNPDLIVLDHILEGVDEHTLNGLETLKEIRRINREIPVVILTGQGDDKLLSEFMENGADKYLTKDDYFINSLIETIEQVLN